MRRAWRYAVGFTHRLTYATLFSVVAWYACSYPEAFGKHFTLQKSICYVLTYPTALIGRFTDPYRGMDVFSGRGGEWCDFCSAQQVLWYHVRFAVPVYVLLFYGPTLIVWVIRKRGHRLNDRAKAPDFPSPGRS
jgi:hypothetical protein